MTAPGPRKPGPRYYSGSNAFASHDLVRPGTACVVAVVDRPGAAYPTLGIAYPGVRLDSADETGWHLEVGGVRLPGVWVLRRGEFLPCVRGA